MSAAPIIIIIKRPPQQASRIHQAGETESQLQVLAPAEATDADILQLALDQLQAEG